MSEENYTFIISENLVNYRLDKALTELTKYSRSKIKALIDYGCVTNKGNIISDASLKVKLNQVIVLKLLPSSPLEILPLKISLDIVYEDKDLIVLNKPAGLTVHPGAGNHNDTLVNALIHHAGEDLSNIGGLERPGIVHRLDKDTTGLMVVAKNNITHANLSEQIALRDLKRVYKAIIWGIPSPLEGKIAANIIRSRADRTKMTICKNAGKEATTFYKVNEIIANGQISLVECKLQTGRTHQIRVHMSHLGHSVIGDQLYGHNQRKITKYFSGEQKEALQNFKRQALHSSYIAFEHPTTKELLEFTCNLPNDMQSLLEILQG